MTTAVSLRCTAALVILAACSVWAKPEALPGLRGRLLYQGAPVPHAFIQIEPDNRSWPGSDALGGNTPHPGLSRRRWLSLSGEFSARGLTDGNYSVSAQLQAVADVLVPSRSYPYRVTIVRDRLRLYDETGVPIDESKIDLDLALSSAPIPSAVGRFRGTVRFLGSHLPNFDRAPLFLAAKPLSYSDAERSRLPALMMTRIMGSPGADRASFELAVATGMHYTLQMQSNDWAVVACDPQANSIQVTTVPVILHIAVVAAGRVHGRVYLPDGSPYRPSPPKHSAWIRLSPDAMAFDRQVDADGTFDIIGVPPGRFTGELFGNGASFVWGVAPIESLRVAPGQTTRVDVALRKAVPVDPPLPPWPPLPEQQQRWSANRQRWIRPLPAGTMLDRRQALRLLFRVYFEFFQFRLNQRGAWRPTDPGPGVVLALPGRYDLYALELRGDLQKSPFVRVLSKELNYNVQEGARKQIVLAPPGESTAAAVAGAISGLVPPTDSDLESGDGDSIFRLLLSLPTMTLRDESGAPVAFAWAMPPGLTLNAVLSVATEALATRDLRPLRALLAQPSYSFEIPGVPAGSYKLEFWAAHCRAMTQDIRVGSAPVTADFVCAARDLRLTSHARKTRAHRSDLR